MKRLILVVLLVTAVSIAFVRAYFWEAFPQASIDLKYSKEQITQKAEAFLRGQHLDPSRFRNLTLFDDDDDARMYLEREMGLLEAQLAGSFHDHRESKRLVKEIAGRKEQLDALLAEWEQVGAALET